MTDRPEFIDNRDGNTLAQALGAFLGKSEDGKSRDTGEAPGEVRIASAFFNPTGFARIADHLQFVPVVRLLLGADPAGVPDESKRLEETPAMFERRRMGAGLQRMEDALHRERDSLPFTRTSATALRKLIEALQRDNLEVRRYEQAFLHAKAYIVSSTAEAYGKCDGVIVGSSNLTHAGLTRNLELNLGRYDQPIVERAQQWFDDLWDDAEPYDLAEVFEAVLQPYQPWDIFIRVLWYLYGDEVEQDAEVERDLPLTSFQKHGVARALRLIRELGGAMVADEVGLGKTFIAGEILQHYNDQRQRALLICPASLRDSTWKQFLSQYRLFVECLSFEQLGNEIQLRDRYRPHADKEHLQRPLNEYQLVIIDEAHNYRNPDAHTRAGALRRLMIGEQRRDLLLLTATPVNNSLWDLYHLLRFFLRQDAHLADRGIISIREQFAWAMQQNPSDLSPDLLYPIIDATTVKRTRQFVKKHYEGDNIRTPEGIERPIIFPKPVAISVRYNLEDLLPGFFDRLEAALDPDGGAIKFARYTPQEYLLAEIDEEDEEKSSGRARALAGLLRSGLLKRFESSARAFHRTVEKMEREHGLFLEALDAGQVLTTKFMQELSADDEAVFEQMLEKAKRLEDETLYDDAGLYDIEGLRAAVEQDRRHFSELAQLAVRIVPEQDPKLRVLSDALVEIAQQAENESTSSHDKSQKRKVLVFSFFEDTVEWIRDFLKREMAVRPELADYRKRMAVVSGSGDLSKGISRQQAVDGFAPQSMQAVNSGDSYDLLISTDVLAEGVNLQQCRNIVNFDMPWNPMRLVQRHGRIDRINSEHPRVFMRTIFPADRLDRLLNLEGRILDKLAMAAASVGVAAPIEGAAVGRQVFTETREEIEKLLAEDASLYERGSTASAAQTGEEYRQTLRKALVNDRERIVGMPWKIGSGMRKGARRGIFFCAVVGRDSDKLRRRYLRFVAATEDWLPGEGITTELAACLRLIECTEDTPIWYPDLLQERVYDFWEVAREDILKDWMHQTDPANLQPTVRPLNHRVAQFIRENLPTGLAEDRVEKALDILESPWPRREEIMLREWFQRSEQEGAALSSFLIEQIIETGIEPARPPPPLPPIEAEDIELLCWMGIEAEEEAEAEVSQPPASADKPASNSS